MAKSMTVKQAVKILRPYVLSHLAERCQGFANLEYEIEEAEQHGWRDDVGYLGNVPLKRRLLKDDLKYLRQVINDLHRLEG